MHVGVCRCVLVCVYVCFRPKVLCTELCWVLVLGESTLNKSGMRVPQAIVNKPALRHLPAVGDRA